MSRSGYDEGYELDNWQLIRWRGQVASAIKGKRGQAFLRELAETLDAMPEKRLIAHDLRAGADVCTLGCISAARGLDLERFDPDDWSHRDALGQALNIAMPLVAEIEWENDQAGPYAGETPEQRWRRMRSWVAASLTPAPEPGDGG